MQEKNLRKAIDEQLTKEKFSAWIESGAFKGQHKTDIKNTAEHLEYLKEIDGHFLCDYFGDMVYGGDYFSERSKRGKEITQALEELATEGVLKKLSKDSYAFV